MSADGQRPAGDGAPGTGPEGNGAKGNGPLPSRLPAAGARRGGPPWMNVGLPAEKSMNFGPSARRLVGRLRQYRLQLAAIITLSVLSVTMSVIGPRVLGRATDIIFAGYIGRQLPVDTSLAATVARLRANGDDNRANLLEKVNAVPGQGVDFHQLGRVLLLALVLFAGASVLMWLQAYMLTGVTQATVRELRAEAEDKLGRLPLSYFDGQPRGELLSRVTNDIDNISQTLQQTISQVLTSVLTVIGVLIMMFSISWQLALIALVAVPLTIAVTRQIAKRSQPLFIAQWQHTGALNADVEEAFTGHELVKVFGRHREVEETFGAKNEQLYGASFGAQFVSGTIMPATMFIGNLSYVAIAVAGGLRVASGTMSLGDVQAFIQYSRQFTQPLTQIASMMNTLQSGVASAERVFDLLDADEQSPDPEPAVDLHDARGRVEFRDVTFRYREDRPLIEQLSLVAEPGQTVAIVGPTGAGKTTLVNLIMRFYELDGGSILLDGVDIRTMRRADLRAEIGMVLQDAWLFGGTIRENIRYGRPDATDDEVLAAAQATLVDRFVHSLPDGYDTMIDEEGAGISAGEKQLITIARAFLAAPSLLILDEATSSVDTRTEVLVQRAMATLREGRTSFVIAHRLSTIRDADLILVMEHGRIVEQGTSAELLAVNGAYRRLYEAQFAQAVADHDAEATGADGAAGAVPAGRGS